MTQNMWAICTLHCVHLNNIKHTMTINIQSRKVILIIPIVNTCVVIVMHYTLIWQTCCINKSMCECLHNNTHLGEKAFSQVRSLQSFILQEWSSQPWYLKIEWSQQWHIMWYSQVELAQVLNSFLDLLRVWNSTN